MKTAKYNYEQLSDLLKTLGHPLRLRIVAGLLNHEECNVSDMIKNLQVPQSTISQQLAILRTKGILATRREGTKVCYRIINPLVKKIVNILTHSVEG